MNFKFYCFLFLFFFNNTYSFQNKIFLPTLNINFKSFMTPNEMISYLTTFREYTIITVGNDYKKLEEIMINKKINVYYVDLNNIFDKKDILSFLRDKYNNYDSAEDLWIFHKGFFIGSYNDIIKIIDKKKNLKYQYKYHNK